MRVLTVLLLKGKGMQRYAVTLFSLIALAVLASSSAIAAKKTIIIEADEWCPINCAPGNYEGIGIDLARKVFEPMGYEIKYVIVPWTKALADVRSGEIYAVVGANRNDDNTLVFPDIPVTTITDDFFVRASSPWQYQGVHTLKNKRIGVIESYGYGDVVTSFLQQNRNTVHLIHTATGNNALMENVEKLVNGQLDIVVENRTVIEQALKNYEHKDKIKWAGGVPQAPVYLAFSPVLPESKQLAAYYDAAIRRMRRDGSLKTLYAKYGLTPP